MAGKGIAHPRRVTFPESGAAFNVGHQEGDRSCRQGHRGLPLLSDVSNACKDKWVPGNFAGQSK
jgi:hypothetical protein